ncbi:glycosyltransferase family 4 protein [Chryseobacterium sp. NKUCC03_KSP]|uniref:glycosyltransferase family 4 protein n=1 Tax=Chryseobacterium sp. NKUCC03_KSP TaxID=2842125 RepID=UPI001C5BB950|nr:glycosyltransferase family 4 protein [Chryseobacterium sp. NKUCC03_KSP]MBW3523410.1 glycosyltransferase family 4 protein [Chryseobacterium sp. NKUCC03_KSP]
MKIYFPIGAFYPSQIGGPCNTLFWHTCALKSNGVNVDITTTALGLKDGEIELDKILKKECGSVYYGSTSSISRKVLKQIFSGIPSADVIHLNSLFNILSIISFFYIKLFFSTKKIIWSVRGELSSNALQFSRLKKKPLLFLYKKTTKNVLFHSTSEKETAEIKSVYGGVRTVEIPNFIEPSKRRADIVKKQFLYLGRIHRIKAIHKMIEGFYKSKEFMNSDFKLIIVGKHEERHSDYYEEILKLVTSKNLQDKIEFRGHLTGDDKEKVYAESYALILPSETENFGNVVIESLNQGTPVIASKGTPWSILEKYKCGFHITNKPQEIADTVDRMIDLSLDTYNKMRKNSVLLVDQEFNINTQIDKWINIYNNENSK